MSCLQLYSWTSLYCDGCSYRGILLLCGETERYFGCVFYHDWYVCQTLWCCRIGFLLLLKHKVKFVASLVGWAVLFFVLPMLISSPEYIIGQYQEWKMSLAGKNMENMFSTMQNQSLLGLVRKISHVSTYSDLWLIVPGILAFCAPYLRFSQYRNLYFRYAFLASF